ncbi:MAG: tetratricopeptide repeat protein [Thermodesulfobacteriota bacterium]
MRAHALRPGDHRLALHLGSLLCQLGRTAEALVLLRKYQEALAGDPAFLFLLGSVLAETGEKTEAIACLRRAVHHQPDHVEAHANLAFLLNDRRDLAGALVHGRRACELAPTDAKLAFSLASIHHDAGDVASASGLYRKALSLNPDMPLVRSVLVMLGNYDSRCSRSERALQARRWWRLHGEGQPRPFRFGHLDADSERPLRIGFVSPDFRRHSVSCFLLPLLEHLDPRRFLVHAYANQQIEDEITARIRNCCHKFTAIWGLPPEKAAGCIHADQIDILVDLAGHSRHNSLLVFAMRPAPIQVSWLGYPATTGLATMDYRITDALVDPPGLGEEELYSEKLIRLSGPFLCYTPPAGAPEPDITGKTERLHPVFGSFNNPDKLNQETAAAWAAILATLPDARLLLKNRRLDNSLAREHCLALLRQAGVAAERVRIDGGEADTAAHLRRYADIDVALDTFPYNGTTTTCEALWMGTPVVALAGDCHAARVSAAILERIGMADLAAAGVDRYVAAAAGLASDRGRLLELCRGMRGRLAASPLCDGRRFAGEMASTFIGLWRSYRDAR